MNVFYYIHIINDKKTTEQNIKKSLLEHIQELPVIPIIFFPSRHKKN